MCDFRVLFAFFLLGAACSATTSAGGGSVIAANDADTGGSLSGPDADAQATGQTDAVAAETVVDVPVLHDGTAAPTDCLSCLSNDDCATGWFCAQFQSSSFCAKDCATTTCSSGHGCQAIAGANGDQLKVCVPTASPCGPTDSVPDVADSGPGADTNGLICGSLNGPGVTSCCKCAGTSCDPNGCYGGWFCNTGTCKCNPAPAPSSCGGVDAGPTDTGAPGTDAATGDTEGVQSIGPGGGKLASLAFAIVGDTRPPNKDDISGYPTAVITQIFKDVQAENPSLPFVITTGDYQFSTPSSANAGPQLDLYLQARALYTGTVFYTLGNHECTGATDSNCGTGNPDGITKTYTTFMTKMLAPLGVAAPFYEVDVAATDGSWTAKFLFVAANAWTAAQATWLDSAMAKPTTYTFVVRHEGSVVTNTPGVSPSAAIIAKYPYTLLLVGHTHTFEYFASERQVVTGNGGAPLATGVNYGYVVLRQRADKALVITAYDYATHATIQNFVVKPDGTPTK